MRVFITGITGTLGTALALRHAEKADTVFGCARNEEKVVRWLGGYGKRMAVVFVADAFRLADPEGDMGRLLPSLDRVYHCAALKHVDVCQRQPEDACLQNVYLTDALAAACQERLVFVSSDKACLPEGVYGATKLLGESLVTSRGGVVVRLGNLIGSSGSVFRRWMRNVEKGKPVCVTDEDMTRYFMRVPDAVDILTEHTQGHGGDVVCPNHLKSVRMGDISLKIAGDKVPVSVTGARPGETRHQWLVAPGTICRTSEKVIVLGHGYVDLKEGMCSSTAERWDLDELVKTITEEEGKE